MAMQFKRGSNPQWTGVLDDGQPAVLKRDGKSPRLKIGDGTNTFTQLPFATPDADVYTDNSINPYIGSMHMLPKTFSIVFKSDSLDGYKVDFCNYRSESFKSTDGQNGVDFGYGGIECGGIEIADGGAIIQQNTAITSHPVFTYDGKTSPSITLNGNSSTYGVLSIKTEPTTSNTSNPVGFSFELRGAGTTSFDLLWVSTGSGDPSLVNMMNDGTSGYFPYTSIGNIGCEESYWKNAYLEHTYTSVTTYADSEHTPKMKIEYNDTTQAIEFISL